LLLMLLELMLLAQMLEPQVQVQQQVLKPH
jgi:hypothetical protein